jgi:transcription termination/antitermination protein NusG
VQVLVFPPTFPEVRILLEKASVFYLSAATPITEGCQHLAPSRKWFAVYTKCRHEKRVAQHLLQREIAHYLPLYRAERSWKSCGQVSLDLPLFPGYVFVNVSSSERVRALQVPGVVTMVGGLDGRPASISEEEIESLQAGLHHRRAEPHPYLAAGQRVRIRSGALSGIEGRVVRVKNGLRVVLSLDLIMQSFSVEVKSEELESLEAESCRATSAA